MSRNLDAESRTAKSFASLQSEILSAFGTDSPTTPQLRCRNATQTSVVLEWDPISLAAADLRSLTLFRNGSKAGNIPKPLENTSSKISGLAVDQEYTFSLVLRTSGGTYSSDRLTVRTHKMTDLSGITITPGVMAPQLRDSLDVTVEKIGAKIVEDVQIHTTHFVCTEGRGAAWEKAVEMNVPVVVPDWVKGCELEGRIVGVRGYYLNAAPKMRQLGPGPSLQREESQTSVSTVRTPVPESEASKSQTQLAVPETQVTPPTPDTKHAPHEGDDDDEDEDEEASASARASAQSSSEHLPDRSKAPAKEQPGEDDDDEDDGDIGGGGFDDVKL